MQALPFFFSLIMYLTARNSITAINITAINVAVFIVFLLFLS